MCVCINANVCLHSYMMDISPELIDPVNTDKRLIVHGILFVGETQ